MESNDCINYISFRYLRSFWFLRKMLPSQKQNIWRRNVHQSPTHNSPSNSYGIYLEFKSYFHEYCRCRRLFFSRTPDMKGLRNSYEVFMCTQAYANPISQWAAFHNYFKFFSMYFAVGILVRITLLIWLFSRLKGPLTVGLTWTQLVFCSIKQQDFSKPQTVILQTPSLL